MLAEVTAVIGALNAVNGAISTLKETKSNVDSISRVFGKVTQAASGLAEVEEKVRTGKLVLSTTDAMKISMAKKQVADYEKQLKDLFIYSGNGDMYNEMKKIQITSIQAAKNRATKAKAATAAKNQQTKNEVMILAITIVVLILTVSGGFLWTVLR
jgi:hypothetical protein|tara:strand:+ start:17 stop:484 length:468 start_codon:yes stop_codon:yes gene_type:complete